MPAKKRKTSRKRGRPAGSASVKKLDVRKKSGVTKNKSAPRKLKSATLGDSKSAGRKQVGRPRKTTLTASRTKKRGPGRPRKATSIELNTPRRRGRPRKTST